MNLSPLEARLVATLTAELAGLLNLNPDDPTALAIFPASENTAPPAYPCLTYRMTATPDNRMAPTRAEGGGQSKAYSVALSLQAWSATNGKTAENIITKAETGLTGKYFNFDGGTIHEVQTLTNEQARLDPKLKAYFALLLLRLRVYIPNP